jgi:tRNASer (uridine44-2'-O)-methyltransferase
LILRSETVADIIIPSAVADSDDLPSSSIPKLEGLRPCRCVHRKLLPRRPGRDEGLEQFCTLFREISTLADHDADIPTALILTPLIAPGNPLPYYHPAVSHLAFRYIPSQPPTLQIDAVLLPGTPTDLNSRLYRTCLSLLDTLHRYGWGAMTNYKKRVIHDCLVPREAYQDLYLVMRERHKHLVEQWQEITDPLKHVYEVGNSAQWIVYQKP